METKITQAEEILNKCQSKTKLTPEGKEWLIAVLDPLHDTKLLCKGMPDKEVAPSVVEPVPSTVKIVSPYASDQQWGFHIYLDDFAIGSQSQYGPNDRAQGDVLYVDTTTSGTVTRKMPYGGLNIVYFNETAGGTADNCYDAPIQPSGTVNLTDQRSLDPSYYYGKNRVIGAGLEIVNTTSELYKAGSLLVYEEPRISRDITSLSMVQNSSGGTTYKSISTVIETATPRGVQDAIKLPGSKQWDAAKGCYFVQTMSTTDNYAAMPEVLAAAFTTDQSKWPTVVQSDPVITQPIYSPTGTAVSYGGFVVGSYNFNRRKPFNKKGCILSGLTPQSTFTVNWMEIIEKFVSTQDTVLLTFATPSPAEDPLAIEVYTKIARDMPVGAHFDENDFGDWFMGIAKAIGIAVGIPPFMTNAVGEFVGELTGKSTVNSNNKKLVPSSYEIQNKPGIEQRLLNENNKLLNMLANQNSDRMLPNQKQTQKQKSNNMTNKNKQKQMSIRPTNMNVLGNTLTKKEIALWKEMAKKL